MRLALRVDAYYRQHGKLPATLDEVLDEEHTQVPLGTLSDLPVVYKTTPTGFKIYDVGANLVDDGGTQRG
jgi:hypothetical protein